MGHEEEAVPVPPHATIAPSRSAGPGSSVMYSNDVRDGLPQSVLSVGRAAPSLPPPGDAPRMVSPLTVQE